MTHNAVATNPKLLMYSLAAVWATLNFSWLHVAEEVTDSICAS